MLKHWIIGLLGLCLLTTGCGHKGAEARASKRLAAPSVPAKEWMPLDRNLQSRARNEIDLAAASDDMLSRAHAIEAMRQTYQREYELLIVRMLSDRSPIVRKSAVLAVGELKLAGALPMVRSMLDDNDPNVRVAVRFALHVLGDTSNSHDLEAYARDSSREVRADTAMVLGLMKEPTAINVLRVLWHDKEAIVRLQACEAMWKLGDERGMEELIAATLSAYVDDQMFAYSGLAAGKDPRVIEHIRVGLVSDYAEASLVAARAMGDLGSDAGYGVALMYVGSKVPHQRSMAAIAFGAIRRPDAQPMLDKLLRDKDPDVRLAAAVGILELAKPRPI